MKKVEWERKLDAKKKVVWPAIQRPTGREADEHWQRRDGEYAKAAAVKAFPPGTLRAAPTRAQ
eukprot:7578371-Lingulodinium_polyedra.AAC.1